MLMSCHNFITHSKAIFVQTTAKAAGYGTNLLPYLLTYLITYLLTYFLTYLLNYFLT